MSELYIVLDAAGAAMLLSRCFPMDSRQDAIRRACYAFIGGGLLGELIVHALRELRGV